MSIAFDQTLSPGLRMYRRMKLEDLVYRLHLLALPDPDSWIQHPNGEGWVEKTAKVDLSAYVGPDAIVCEEAQVLQNAKILGRTVVDGSAIVAGDVTVEGDSRIREMAVLAGDAHVRGKSWVGGNAVLTSGVYEDLSMRPWTKADISQRNRTARSLHLS